MLQGETCATCIFFMPMQKAGEVTQGYCRRNPPVALLKTMAVPSKVLGAPPEIQHMLEAHYPPIIDSYPACGEHLTSADLENDTPT